MKVAKIVTITAVGGTMFGLTGCLSTDNLMASAATYAAMEFVFDNDSVFDMFQDDHGTGSEYDDRFVVDPSRTELE